MTAKQDIVFDAVALKCGHILCYMCACSAASVTIVDGLKTAEPHKKCPLCREVKTPKKEKQLKLFLKIQISIGEFIGRQEVFFLICKLYFFNPHCQMSHECQNVVESDRAYMAESLCRKILHNAHSILIAI